MAAVILFYEVFFFGSLPLSSCLWYCCHTTEIAETNKMHDFVLEDMLCNNHKIYSQSFAVCVCDNLRRDVKHFKLCLYFLNIASLPLEEH